MILLTNSFCSSGIETGPLDTNVLDCPSGVMNAGDENWENDWCFCCKASLNCVSCDLVRCDIPKKTCE